MGWCWCEVNVCRDRMVGYDEEGLRLGDGVRIDSWRKGKETCILFGSVGFNMLDSSPVSYQMENKKESGIHCGFTVQISDYSLSTILSVKRNLSTWINNKVNKQAMGKDWQRVKERRKAYRYVCILPLPTPAKTPLFKCNVRRHFHSPYRLSLPPSPLVW